MENYQPGSKADFDRLYQASYPRIFRTVLAIVGEPAAAEDCVQDAFLKAFKAWPEFKGDAPPEAWLHRIAVNVALSWRRHSKLREVGEVLRRFGRPVDRISGPESAVEPDLLEALRELPPKLAAAIVLRHVHGYTNREIAVALGIPERTVASRLIAARARLRARLGGGEVDGDKTAARVEYSAAAARPD
jgi:RNA polymerase sigma-70 factor, ECF subfamily